MLERIYLRDNSAAGLAVAVGLIAAATLARLLLAPIDAGFPYITYSPAVFLAFLVGGTLAGFVAAMLGILTTTYLFVPPILTLALKVDELWNVATFFMACVVGGLPIARLRKITWALQEEQAANKSLLQDKDVLFNELNHRVKNNLQVVSSLLSLRQRQVDDPVAREIIDQALGRVNAIGLAHQILYQTNSPSDIEMTKYVAALGKQIAASYGAERSGITIEVRGGLTLSIAQAVPAGLAINEMVSNSFKHAYPDGNGVIVVELGNVGPGTVFLAVSDTGIGVPPALEPGFGIRITQSLAQQLGGKLDIQKPPAGSRMEIIFPRR